MLPFRVVEYTVVYIRGKVDQCQNSEMIQGKWIFLSAQRVWQRAYSHDQSLNIHSSWFGSFHLLVSRRGHPGLDTGPKPLLSIFRLNIHFQDELHTRALNHVKLGHRDIWRNFQIQLCKTNSIEKKKTFPSVPGLEHWTLRIKIQQYPVRYETW